MKEVVSIILPIYNVENYLEKCVKSVQNQTYENLEIILVDDGATDSCGQICDRLEEEDNRIKVVHKKNGGLASARNAGYQVATGDYVMYIDSDDTVKKELVEVCVKKANSENSDVVIYGYEKVDEQGNILETCAWENVSYTHMQMVNKLYDAIIEMSFGYVWNKMYRKCILDKSNILGDAQVIDREDLVYNMELLKYLNKITYIDYVGYEYLQRSTSLLHNSNLARLNGIEYFVNRVHNVDIEEAGKKVFNMVVLHYLADAIIKNIIWNADLSTKEKKKLMKETINRCPYKEELYLDTDNPKHLRQLFRSIDTGRMKYFYYYVRLGDLKRKIVK